MATKDNATYWLDRMLELDASQEKRNNLFDKKMRTQYHTLEESLKKDVASYYQKYGKDDVIEYRKLVLSLTDSERNLLYKDYDAFFLRNPKYAHLIPTRESIYRLNRLEGLQLSTRMQMVELGAFEQEGLEELLKEAYENGYLSTMKGLDNASAAFGVNNNAMAQTINEKWSNGANFSDNVWDNKEKLINTINNEIRDGIIRGDSYHKMATTLRRRTEVGAYESLRLAVTESSFVTNQANKQAFMDDGITRYKVSAVLDKRTSRTCEHLDGQKFKFADAKVGLNFPPFHPWCRTTIVPVENDR